MKEFKVVAKERSTEIMFYGVVGDDPWSGDGISAKQFREAVKSVKTKEIDLRLNTPGGDVFEAVAMVAALDGFKKSGTVNVYVDGLAASAGSVIAMAGNRITMADGSMMMAHNPYTIVIGGRDEMMRKADLLDKIKTDIIAAYKRHSHLDEQAISDLMDEETWFTAQEAVDNGFATEVNGSARVAAFSDMNRYQYRNMPKIKAPTYTDEQWKQHNERMAILDSMLAE